MGAQIPVSLADFLAIKGLALVAAGIVAYLFWTDIREKRELRRQRRWLENKRREVREKTAQQIEHPPPAA